MKFSKLEKFLIKLQRSWEEAMKSMKIAKEVMKRQFNKKRQNPQELKTEDNVWLKAKNLFKSTLLIRKDMNSLES